MRLCASYVHAGLFLYDEILVKESKNKDRDNEIKSCGEEATAELRDANIGDYKYYK